MDKPKIRRRPLITVDRVSIKVPKLGPHSKMIPRTSFTDESGELVEIQPHFKHGFLAKSNPPEIVFRHFYDLPPAIFGKKIVARVEVFLKVTPDGEKYVYEDIHCLKGVTATHDHCYTDNGVGEVFIPRTNKRIWFKPRDIKPLSKKEFEDQELADWQWEWDKAQEVYGTNKKVNL